MNFFLNALQLYPFEKLRQLLASEQAPFDQIPPINLSIGEPQHAFPACITEAITHHLEGLSVYPPTKGDASLRLTIANWLAQRYCIPTPNPETEVLPVLAHAKPCSHLLKR